MYKRAEVETNYESFDVEEDSGSITKCFYNEATLYVENNGLSDEAVLTLFDAMIATHPKFSMLYPEGKPYSRGQTYFSISVHKKLPELRDCTYIFVFNPRLYRYLVCRDAETGKIKMRIPLTPELEKQKKADNITYMTTTTGSWADDTDNNDLYDNKYDLLTRPYQVPGVTVFDDSMKERFWKRFISHPKDIAVMRGYVKRVKDGLIPNKLVVSNLPSVIVTEDYARTMANRFATTRSYKPKIEYETYTDKKTDPANPKLRARMTIEYDPKTMDAAFASIFFRNYTFRSKTQEEVLLRCDYARLGGGGKRY